MLEVSSTRCVFIARMYTMRPVPSVAKILRVCAIEVKIA